MNTTSSTAPKTGCGGSPRCTPMCWRPAGGMRRPGLALDAGCGTGGRWRGSPRRSAIGSTPMPEPAPKAAKLASGPRRVDRRPALRRCRVSRDRQPDVSVIAASMAAGEQFHCCRRRHACPQSAGLPLDDAAPRCSGLQCAAPPRRGVIALLRDAGFRLSRAIEHAAVSADGVDARLRRAAVACRRSWHGSKLLAGPLALSVR